MQGNALRYSADASPLSPPADDDRLRRLTAFSRHDETPGRLVIELTADGADYHSLGDFAPDPFDEGCGRLSCHNS
jgi:hypothetical protein